MGETAAQQLYRESQDERWLDPDYARRMAGPMMAAKHRAERRAREQSEALRARKGSPHFVYLKRMLCGARKNAARKGLACTMTDDELWTLLESSGGRCAVTGVPFSLERHGAGRAPLAPSLDRIDDGKGYQVGNVRLVCQIANLAMNVWCAETLRDFVRKAAANL
jgi:hypothetical protein